MHKEHNYQNYQPKLNPREVKMAKKVKTIIFKFFISIFLQYFFFLAEVRVLSRLVD